MTQDEIIEMARQAAAVYGHTFKEIPSPETVEFITSFYKLVAEREREECAVICDLFQARNVGMQPAECAGAIRARGEA